MAARAKALPGGFRPGTEKHPVCFVHFFPCAAIQFTINFKFAVSPQRDLLPADLPVQLRAAYFAMALHAMNSGAAVTAVSVRAASQPIMAALRLLPQW